MTVQKEGFKTAKAKIFLTKGTAPVCPEIMLTLNQEGDGRAILYNRMNQRFIIRATDWKRAGGEKES